jgi:hypothetical protein
MDRESYRDEIFSMFLQCEHERGVDVPQLMYLLGKLRDAASSEGLAHSDFESLVKSVLPGVWENLSAKPKAA